MAAQPKLFGKDLSAYADIDIDELLGQLTDEQLEELGQELIDPDDSHIPPSERCRYKTTKEPTGPFNRKKLIEFLETKAKEEKDWDEPVPYTKETRGKVYVPKKEEKIAVGDDDDELSTEWDEVLANATEEELVDLAAILGFHGMLNQVQYHNAFVAQQTDEEKEAAKAKGGGFQGVAKHQNFKLFEEAKPNDTDVEASLQKLQANDASLKVLNLNNIKNISLERLGEIGRALKNNTVLEELHMANTKSTDRVAKAIAEGLQDNKTVKVINLESNYISGQGIIAVMEAININKTVHEFRIVNQRPQVLGNKVEMKLARLMEENGTLLRFGIFLEVPDARVRVQEYIKRNHDNLRRTRVGEPIQEPPKRESTPERQRRLQEKVRENKAAAAAAQSKAAEKEESESEEEESDEEEE